MGRNTLILPENYLINKAYTGVNRVITNNEVDFCFLRRSFLPICEDHLHIFRSMLLQTLDTIFFNVVFP